MLRLQDMPIKRKLTAIIMIASSVALLLVSAGFVGYEWFTFRQSMVSELTAQANIIGDRSTAALEFLNRSDAQETLRALGFEKHIVAAALYDENGNLFTQWDFTPASVKDRFPNHPEHEGSRFESDRLVLYHDIYVKGNLAGTLCLISDLGALNERLVRYAGIIGVFMLVSLAITLVLSNLLQRVITRPILSLAETVKLVTTEKNYSVRTATPGRDEFGDLTDGFNDMLGEIQRRDNELRQAHDQMEVRVAVRTRALKNEIEGHQRTEAALKQQFVRISLLNQITRAISDRQDTDSILHVVLRQLEDHMGVDFGMVALFDGQTKMLNVAALRVRNSLLAAKFELREGSVLNLGETDFTDCEKGHTCSIFDLVKAKSLLSERLAVLGWRSAVAVPLMVEEKFFGVHISARLKPDDFSSGDVEFLRMLSEHVALAAHQAALHINLENAYNDLRRSQATVLQQERLKALGQMASGIAHDVNNALSPVVGFTDLILQGNYGLNDAGKKYLKHVRTAGEDIAHIVARLKEFYRTRDAAESLQRLNLNTLAEQVVEMTRPRWRDIPQSNGITIEVETELAPGAPALVGIESEIREAFTNLVLNAVDAMPEGGKITLSTIVVPNPSEQEPEGKAVVVGIKDSGTGMSEETRKRCLEPFFSTKGKRGTGLGLAMVYGVMERHEGGIEIQSELGKGTTFFLKFPVRAKAWRNESDDEQKNVEVSPMRILCIDDEPLVRDLIKEMLERDGHEVQSADGGQSGVAEFRLAQQNHRPFDLVITDLGMPYIDGRQVAKIIKSESPQTPVVMLTGWGAFMKEDGNAPQQVDCVISKPPRSKALREVIYRFHPAHILAGTN